MNDLPTYGSYVEANRKAGSYGFHGNEDLFPYWVLLFRNRDSPAVDEVNFTTALEMLGGESDDVQVIRESHWAVGWLEFIIVNPSNADKRTIALDIKARLEAYPILDEDALLQYEWDNHIDWVEIAGVEMPPDADPWSNLEDWAAWVDAANDKYLDPADAHEEQTAINDWLDDLNHATRDQQLTFAGRPYPQLTEEDLPL